MNPRWALTVILALYVVFATLYATVTPYRQAGYLAMQRGADGAPVRVADIGAPDERQHANYVRWLMDGKGFPVLRPGSPDLYETYQSHQPPAFYVLAAGWAGLTGADPASGETGARLRFLNVLLGMLTVAGVYFCGLWGLGRQDVGLAAAAVIGLMPMFLALHGAVSNDPLLFACMTWVLALAGRWLRDRPVTPWLPVSIGVLTGLGLLTKTTAMAMIPALWVAVAFGLRADRRWALRAVPWMLLLPLIVAAPWWIRNQGLYGDPLAIQAFNAAFVGSPMAATFIEHFGAYAYWTQWVGWWTLRSFVGVFGYMDVFLPVWLYLVAWLGLLGLVLFAALGRGRDPERRQLGNGAFGWTAAALGLVVLAMFVQFNMTFFQAQARYLYPACAAIGLGLGLGAARAMGRWRDWAWAACSVPLVALNLYALGEVSEAFARAVAV
jgi:4-amino-4-deoxy-L-arabinose transferase-like glycosyltransferase